VIGVVLAALLVGAPAADAARSWSPPVAIGALTPFAPSNEQAVATVTEAGEVLAVWNDPGLGVLRAAVRPAPPSAPLIQTLVGGAGPMAIASDAAGNAVVAMHTRSGILYALRPAGGVFGPVMTLDASGSGEPRVAMTPAGDAVIVYEREVAGGVRVIGARRPAGGTFGPPVELTPTLDVDRSPPSGDLVRFLWLNDVVLSPAGEATVSWQRGASHSQAVEAVRWPAAGGPHAVQELSGIGTDPELGVDARGNVVVAWIDGPHQIGGAMMAAFAHPGGDFGTPAPLGADSIYPESFQPAETSLAMRPDGRFAIAFDRITTHSANTGSANGVWMSYGDAAAETLSAPGPAQTVVNTEPLLVTATPDGGWLLFSEAYSAHVLRATRVSPSGIAGPEEALHCPDAGVPIAARQSATGTTTLVWMQRDEVARARQLMISDDRPGPDTDPNCGVNWWTITTGPPGSWTPMQPTGPPPGIPPTVPPAHAQPANLPTAAGSPPAPAPPPPPLQELRTARHVTLKRAVRRGIVARLIGRRESTVRVRLSMPARSRIRASRRHSKTIASRSLALHAGRGTLVRLRLDRKARHALRARTRTRLTLRADASGTPLGQWHVTLTR
jgi:hypothetical protein